MSGLPAHIEADIASHMDAIKAHFRNPKITVLIRPDIGPGKDADVLLTDDDPHEAISAIARRVAAGKDT